MTSNVTADEAQAAPLVSEALFVARDTDRAQFSEGQVRQLLLAINNDRVMMTSGHAHLSQQDVTAHLIRIFGFGNFDVEVKEVGVVFAKSGMRKKRNSNEEYEAHDVCYRALVRLSVRNPDGQLVTVIEDGSTATAQGQPSEGDAHDLAYKSAISLSTKRCAAKLGDQFGLSLYNRGQRTALVKGTLVGVPRKDAEADVQEGVDQQVDPGNAEGAEVLDAAGEPTGTAMPPQDEAWLAEGERLRELAKASPDKDGAIEVWTKARDAGYPQALLDLIASENDSKPVRQ